MHAGFVLRCLLSPDACSHPADFVPLLSNNDVSTQTQSAALALPCAPCPPLPDPSFSACASNASTVCTNALCSADLAPLPLPTHPHTHTHTPTTPLPALPHLTASMLAPQRPIRCAPTPSSVQTVPPAPHETTWPVLPLLLQSVQPPGGHWGGCCRGAAAAAVGRCVPPTPAITTRHTGALLLAH
jgi:hypothetical protein